MRSSRSASSLQIGRFRENGVPDGSQVDGSGARAPDHYLQSSTSRTSPARTSPRSSAASRRSRPRSKRAGLRSTPRGDRQHPQPLRQGEAPPGGEPPFPAHPSHGRPAGVRRPANAASSGSLLPVWLIFSLSGSSGDAAQLGGELVCPMGVAEGRKVLGVGADPFPRLLALLDQPQTTAVRLSGEDRGQCGLLRARRRCRGTQPQDRPAELSFSDPQTGTTRRPPALSPRSPATSPTPTALRLRGPPDGPERGRHAQSSRCESSRPRCREPGRRFHRGPAPHS